MTEEIKNRIKEEIDYGNDDRVKAFLNSYKIASSEMTLQMVLKDKNVHFLLFFQDEISFILIGLSFLINFLMSISLEKGYFTGNVNPQYSHLWIEHLMKILQILQLWGYLMTLVQKLILFAPVARDEWYNTVDIILATSTEESTSKLKMSFIALKHFIPFFLLATTGNKLRPL